MGKRDWPMTKKQENIYQNLWNQAQKIYDWRTHHQGKRGTERYREGVKAFCKHLAIVYGSKNFKNIRDEHLQSFIKASIESGVSPSTIKTDLSAMRKLHSLLPKKRYQLSHDNKLLGAEKRKIVGIDRAWNNSEAKKASDLAKSMGRKDVDWAIRCARTMGLRLEELTALTKSQVNEALLKGYIHLKNTKGGIPRDIPLNAGARRVLTEMRDETGNERIFIGHGRTHHQVMKSIKNWVYNHRSLFTEVYVPDRQYNQLIGIDYERTSLTMHGLRHAFARSEYYARVNCGMDKKEALKQVAELLGHGRDDVTKIYLGSSKDE
jgi:integrase/recombinase XerD